MIPNIYSAYLRLLPGAIASAAAHQPNPAADTDMTKKGQPREPGFTQERFDAICALIADGKSLREICELDGMPDRGTFNGWRKRTPELQAQYDQAYRDYEDSVLQDIVFIADTEKDASIAKNRMDARKWELKIRNRKKYGDSITHSGDPDAPVQLVLNGSDIHG